MIENYTADWGWFSLKSWKVLGGFIVTLKNGVEVVITIISCGASPSNPYIGGCFEADSILVGEIDNQKQTKKVNPPKFGKMYAATFSTFVPTIEIKPFHRSEKTIKHFHRIVLKFILGYDWSRLRIKHTPNQTS